MVTTFYPPYHFGGDAVFVRSLANSLCRRGHHVEVVHCEDSFRIRGGEPQREDDYDHGIVVHRLRSRLGPLSPLITQQLGVPGPKAPALRRILANDFDVVNFHNLSLVGGLGALALSRAPVTFYTVHEHWLLCPTHILWKEEKKACDGPDCLRCSIRSGIPPQLWRYGSMRDSALRHVDMVLSPSEFTAQRHREGGVEIPIRVLPTYAHPVPRRDVPPPLRPRFVFSGRVTKSKGIEQLVRLFSRLPEFDLEVAGGGDLLERLRTAYAACEWIRFLGPLPHAAAAERFVGATAAVVPSLAPEVFPLSILESFAAGTPVITRAAGGAAEAVEKFEAGIVADTEEAMESAVRRIAMEPELRRSLRENAWRASEYYSEARYVGEYLALIDEVRAAKGQ